MISSLVAKQDILPGEEVILIKVLYLLTFSHLDGGCQVNSNHKFISETRNNFAFDSLNWKQV